LGLENLSFACPGQKSGTGQGVCLEFSVSDLEFKSFIREEVTRMAQKVAKAGVKREKGYLYFVDKQGDISSAKMSRGSKKGGNPKKVAKVGVDKKEGYLYFVDKQGDVSCAKMVRGGRKRKKR